MIRLLVYAQILFFFTCIPSVVFFKKNVVQRKCLANEHFSIYFIN